MLNADAPAMATKNKATPVEPARTARPKGSRSRALPPTGVAVRAISAGYGAKVTPRQTSGPVPEYGDGVGGARPQPRNPLPMIIGMDMVSIPAFTLWPGSDRQGETPLPTKGDHGEITCSPTAQDHRLASGQAPR